MRYVNWETGTRYTAEDIDEPLKEGRVLIVGHQETFEHLFGTTEKAEQDVYVVIVPK